MHIALSSDQQSFATQCRRMLEKQCPSSLVREVQTPKGSGHSPELHRIIAGAGWLGMATAPPGSDDAGTLFDLGIAFRESGRVLLPTTVYSCVLAGLVLRRSSPTAATQALLETIAAGESLVTLAYLEDGASNPERAAHYETTASSHGSGWQLTGKKSFVLNAGTADVMLVAAGVEGSGSPAFAVFGVDPQAPGVSIRELSTFGHDAQAEVGFAEVSLDGSALVAGPFDELDWAAWLGVPIDEATALLCMEMLGGTERVIDDTVSYVNERIVFDRPIGSFQAVQHFLANAAIAATAGRVAALEALWAISDGRDARREVSTAKSWLARTYKDTTLLAHQLFGGAGYIREADLHLWSQRAKATEPLYGSRNYHLRRLAGLGPATAV